MMYLVSRDGHLWISSNWDSVRTMREHLGLNREVSATDPDLAPFTIPWAKIPEGCTPRAFAKYFSDDIGAARKMIYVIELRCGLPEKEIPANVMPISATRISPAVGWLLGLGALGLVIFFMHRSAKRRN